MNSVPAHYFHFIKTTKLQYSYIATGDLETKQLVRNKPYWRQSIDSRRQEKKTLILADWTIESWDNDKRKQVINQLYELINAGFSIYAWQSGQIEELNKDNMLLLLQESQFQARMASPEAPKNIQRSVIAQLPDGTNDNLLILDDYQIKGLLHPEVFIYPRESDVAELILTLEAKTPMFLDKKHIGPLQQGSLGNIMKDLKLDLDSLVEPQEYVLN